MTFEKFNKELKAMQKGYWTVTEEISNAMLIAKQNPLLDVTIHVPTIDTKLSAEVTINELSMFDEAATRIFVNIATVH